MNKTKLMNGRNVSYREMPGSNDGRVVLMVHGATDHAWIWHHQMDAVHERHRRVAVDLPGRIGTDGPPIDNATDFRGFIKDVAEGLQLEPFVFFGHSMGGSMALDFARYHPASLDGFAMVGSSPSWQMDPSYRSLLRDDPRIGLEKVNEEFGDIFSRHTPQAIRDELFRHAEAVPPATGAADMLACTTYHLENELARIDRPALVICGDEDEGSLPGSRQCGDALSGATFQLVERCGHSIMVEQPAVLNAALNRFLDSLD